jgi:hypothetical protein
VEVSDNWRTVEAVDRVVDVGQVVNVIHVGSFDVLEETLPHRDLEPVGIVAHGGEHAIRDSWTVLE